MAVLYQNLCYSEVLILRLTVREKLSYFGSLYEPRCEKTGLRGFRPGPTQTRL